MTFPVHGLVGAAFTAAAFFNWTRRRFWIASGVGFVLGVLPDLLSFFVGLCGGDGGALKLRFHEGDLLALFGWVAPIGLHAAVDYFPHKVGEWWSTFCWLEILGWVLPLAVLWFIHERTR
jgi:hypothetical protein